MFSEGRRMAGSRKLMKRSEATFDGNQTDDLPSIGNWLFTDEDFHDKVDEALDALMEYLAEGNLRWFLVPMDGFRL